MAQHTQHIKSKRAYRVAELIQSIVAQLLKKEVSDPRLLSVTITGVDLSPDFCKATVFFTLLDPTPASIKEAERAFAKAAGFFRVNVSKLTKLRHTPNLTFRYDETLVTAERVSRLLSDTK